MDWAALTTNPHKAPSFRLGIVPLLPVCAFVVLQGDALLRVFQCTELCVIWLGKIMSTFYATKKALVDSVFGSGIATP